MLPEPIEVQKVSDNLRLLPAIVDPLGERQVSFVLAVIAQQVEQSDLGRETVGKRGRVQLGCRDSCVEVAEPKMQSNGGIQHVCVVFFGGEPAADVTECVRYLAVALVQRDLFPLARQRQDGGGAGGQGKRDQQRSIGRALQSHFDPAAPHEMSTASGSNPAASMVKSSTPVASTCAADDQTDADPRRASIR